MCILFMWNTSPLSPPRVISHLLAYAVSAALETRFKWGKYTVLEMSAEDCKSWASESGWRAEREKEMWLGKKRLDHKTFNRAFWWLNMQIPRKLEVQSYRSCLLCLPPVPQHHHLSRSETELILSGFSWLIWHFSSPSDSKSIDSHSKLVEHSVE